jgi:hypothetical protein
LPIRYIESMPKRTSKDVNEIAKGIVDQIAELTGESNDPERTREASAILDRLEKIGFQIIPRATHANLRGPNSYPSDDLQQILPELKEYWPEIVEVLADRGKVSPAAMLGRRGGLKGGYARAESLTAKKRSRIAKNAAKARWNRK